MQNCIPNKSLTGFCSKQNQGFSVISQKKEIDDSRNRKIQFIKR